MIHERWADPVIPYDVEERSSALIIDGHVYEFPMFILMPDDLERIRLGYVCLRCLHAHEQPYPDQCHNEGCRFPMRSGQDKIFERLYIGNVMVGPQTSDADEWERAKEEIQRDRWKRTARRAGILIP